MVGDDEVGSSREQGVDLRRGRFLFRIELEDENTVAEDVINEDAVLIEDKDFNDEYVDQPSRVSSPGAVGGVDLEGARLPSYEPVKLVQAGVLKIEISI